MPEISQTERLIIINLTQLWFGFNMSSRIFPYQLENQWFPLAVLFFVSRLLPQLWEGFLAFPYFLSQCQLGG